MLPEDGTVAPGGGDDLPDAASQPTFPHGRMLRIDGSGRIEWDPCGCQLPFGSLPIGARLAVIEEFLTRDRAEYVLRIPDKVERRRFVSRYRLKWGDRKADLLEAAIRQEHARRRKLLLAGGAA